MNTFNTNSTLEVTPHKICITEKPIVYNYTNRKGKDVVKQTDCCIVANSASSNTAKFISVIHELAHLFCGHLVKSQYMPKNITFPNRTSEKLTTNQMEAEAEATVKMVFDILGINYDNEEYLNGYLEKDGKMPSVPIAIVIKAGDKVLEMLPDIVRCESVYYQTNKE